MSYETFKQRLVDAVLTTSGDAPSALRRAVLERGKVPAPLAAYVDKVSLHAYKVTDADVAGLAPAPPPGTRGPAAAAAGRPPGGGAGGGYSEDAVFEVTVAAAVGAALYRLERGMAALRGQVPD